MTKIALLLLAALAVSSSAGAAGGTATSPERRAAASDGEGSTIGGSVSRAAFTHGVVNREPIDDIDSTRGATQRHIYFFTELKGLMGETVFHHWEYQGKIMDRMRFEVGGPRWRIWSSKTLLPTWPGEWKVIVTDSAGHRILERIFFNAPEQTAGNE